MMQPLRNLFGPSPGVEQAIGCIMEEEREPILATSEQTRATSALGSGAVINVLAPDCVPGGTNVMPNTICTPSTGAGQDAPLNMAVARRLSLTIKAGALFARPTWLAYLAHPTQCHT